MPLRNTGRFMDAEIVAIGDEIARSKPVPPHSIRQRSHGVGRGRDSASQRRGEAQSAGRIRLDQRDASKAVDPPNVGERFEFGC